ncbi:MAG TPA: hypothetical protein VFQ71_03025 [Gaiellales bacterium]|nr:hypothetical protein [Gaiellales bacterium]
MTNRTQTLVLGFFGLMWISLVVILVSAPEVYDETFRQLPADLHTAEAGFLALITVVMGLLAIGVLRRWRWIFWLLTVAFLGGALHVPAALLELTGVLPTADPIWYVLLQAFVGLVQFALGLLMVAGYRREGPWGAF